MVIRYFKIIINEIYDDHKLSSKYHTKFLETLIQHKDNPTKKKTGRNFSAT